MLAAISIVFAALVLAVGEVIAFATFFSGRAILGDHVRISLGDSGVLRAVAGLGLYLAAIGVFAVAVGALIRHVARAIACVFGVVAVISTLTTLLPGGVGEQVDAYMPGNAGRAILATGGEPDLLLAPWQGFGVLRLWTAVLLALAARLLNRRDA